MPKYIIGSLAICAFLSIAGEGSAQTLPPGQHPATTPPAASSTSTQASTTTTASTTSAPQIDGGTPRYIKAETPEERAKRVGPVDPGLNPDESTLFYRYNRAFNIMKYEKKWAAFDQPEGFCRPVANTPFVFETYQLNDKYVWVWMELPGQDQPVASEAAQQNDQTKPQPASRYTPEQLNYLKYLKPEFTALDVPTTEKTIEFVEASDGLPKAGSWRNSWTIADMNGDGIPDIVTPPQRGGDGLPSIFLGDGKGHWRPWNECVWPFRIDYGAVVAGDFNKDGHMDLAFAVHLRGVFVFLGDGKGHFVDDSAGLPTTNWGSRAIVAADFNGDGYTDIAALTEGPTPLNNEGGAEPPKPLARLHLFLNRDKGKRWENVDVVPANAPVGGDYLAIADLNHDNVPDFITANIYFGSGESIFLSDRKKNVWQPVGGVGKVVPYLSYYFAVAGGPMTSKKTSDALISFVRHWPDDASKIIGAPTLTPVAGIDRVSFSGADPQRSPVIRFPSTRPISGMAIADFDGDGNPDIVFTRFEPTRELVILLGDGKGGFRKAAVTGVQLEPLANYNIAVADVNGDGRPDIIVGYESGEATRLGNQNGSLHVYLNKGPRTAAGAAAKTAAKESQ